MRFESIAVRNLGPFGDVLLDLSGVPGRIVAIAGANGAGKSTLLELLAAGLYRTTPTRGRLSDLATGRDSYLEVRAVNGAAYTIRHQVDAASRKGESLVLDASGAPVLPSGKVAEFDRWASIHLPSPEVFFSSVFSAQGSGGFLEAKPGDRKAILLRALGIERLEGLAEKARDRERDARQALAVVQARLEDERARGLDVEEAEFELRVARGNAEEADAELEIAKEALAKAEEEARKREDALQAAALYSAERARLDVKHVALTERIADLKRRIDNNRRVLDDAEAIRQAVAELETLRRKLDGLRAKRDAALRDAEEHQRTARQWRERAANAKRQADAARQREAAAVRRLADREAIESAVAALEGLRDAVGVAAAKHLEAAEAHEALRGQRVAGAEERAASLRGGLAEVAHESDIEGARTIALATLEEDDRVVEAARSLPGRTQQAYLEALVARTELEQARRALTECERLASRAPDLDLAQLDRDAATAEAQEAEAESLHATAGAALAEDRKAAAMAENGRLDAACRSADDRLAEVEHVVARAKHLDSAAARIEELAPQLDAATAEVVEIGRVVAALGPPPEVPQAPDVEGARLALRQAERAARDAHAAPPVREHALQQARESAERTAQLEQDRTALECELADWSKLAADLGRNGLQAYEIDAVGPELTELVNDLLRSCVGPRWTVSIETQRNSADGKRVLEGCDVRVIDTERGREASAESLSGGERVLVGEAVALALSMLACRRSGVEGPTLVRDETGAALDPANGRAYVAMLRRAADIVGASQVLFVSHSVDVQELADARIVIDDGKVEVKA